MVIEIRPARPGEATEFRLTMGRAFGFDPRDELLSRFQSIWEPERSRVAFDGSEMVATLGTFSLDMTVPGATTPCAGTTMVAVSPTHRRRGILRMLIDAHLDEITERGEPIAALWASESSIYGRFGYGCASTDITLTVPRAHVAFHRLAPSPAPVRLVGPDEAREILPAVFDRIRPGIPGFYARSDAWWERTLFDDPESRNGASSRRYAVVDDGTPRGYASYRVKEEWQEGHGAGEVRVVELMAETPQAASGLWAYLLNHDLTSTITAHNRPGWEPLLDLLAAPRRSKVTHEDGVWVRLMDVPEALAARRYSAPASLVLEVRDPLGRAGGVFRLEVSGEGTAACTPTTGEPDLSLDIEDLGACYLGRARFGRLLGTGRIRGSAAAAASADAAFRWDPPPWCPEVF